MPFLVAVLAVVVVAGCAGAGPKVVFPSEPAVGSVFHAYRKPAGAGPFPAVVVLHTCGGIRMGHTSNWGDRLVGRGYAVVLVDSFTPRGGAECRIPQYFPARVDEVVGDAFAALEHLRQRPDVDARRIGVLGFSYGANAALRTASARYRPAGGSFQAVASFYPMCVSPRSDWPPEAQERANNLFSDVAVPTLVLMGEADIDTPNVASNCARVVGDLKRAGRPIAIELYPGAGHLFDAGASRHPTAAGKATEDMFRFFAEHLKR